MTRRQAIFTAFFASAAFCLVGCLPLWQVPEGLSRMQDVSLWAFLLTLLYEVVRAEGPEHFRFIVRIYGNGILIAGIVWAASFAVGHVWYLLLFSTKKGKLNDRPN